jgi:hypothetical protein
VYTLTWTPTECNRLGRVGPKSAGEPGALDVAAVAEGEEGKQPEAVAGAETWEQDAVALDVHRPEKLDGKG